jgi:hypothetical protein
MQGSGRIWFSERRSSMSLASSNRSEAHLLWRGIPASTKGLTIAIEQTVAGLQGLTQPDDQIDEWQRAWDEVTDTTLEVEEE